MPATWKSQVVKTDGKKGSGILRNASVMIEWEMGF